MTNISYLTLEALKEGYASYAHVREIIKGLRKRGWKVCLYQPKYSQRFPSVFKRLFEFFRIQYILWRKDKFDLLYIRFHFASFPSVILASMKAIPIAVEVNGSYDDFFIAWPWLRFFSKLFIFMMRAHLIKASVIITVTEGLAQWAKSEINNESIKVEVVPNGVNTEIFRPNIPFRNLNNINFPYAVYVGTFAPWQGIETMLEATCLPNWPKGVKLVIAGDGNKRRLVESATKTNPHKVTYLGTIPYESIPELLSNSICALSIQVGSRCRYGIFPVKVFEALSCATPVIVSDFPGVSDLVRQLNCGLVVPPGNAAAVAEAVAFLYRFPRLRKEMGIRGRKAVEKEHSWDARAEATHRILKNLFC